MKEPAGESGEDGGSAANPHESRQVWGVPTAAVMVTGQGVDVGCCRLDFVMKIEDSRLLNMTGVSEYVSGAKAHS